MLWIIYCDVKDRIVSTALHEIDWAILQLTIALIDVKLLPYIYNALCEPIHNRLRFDTKGERILEAARALSADRGDGLFPPDTTRPTYAEYFKARSPSVESEEQAK